jgi:hypothetical protein
LQNFSVKSSWQNPRSIQNLYLTGLPFSVVAKNVFQEKNVCRRFLTGAKCKLDQIHKFFQVCVLANALAKTHFSQRLVLALEKDPDDKTKLWPINVPQLSGVF